MNRNKNLKISIICFDMAHNCLGRAYLLAKVLKRRYHVEFHGSLFPHHGSTIWKPCDTGEFQYLTVKGCQFPEYFSSILRMLKNISGDVVYACKPRMPSYGIALLKKLISFKPVVLDIDDLETSWFSEQHWKTPWRYLLANPIGPLHTRWMEKLYWLANDITTVSTQFQKKFGGVNVPHGKDTDYFNPERFDRKRLREQYGMDDFKVIMFLGTPRPHKGVEDIIKAIKLLKRRDIRFMVVGKGSDTKYENKLLEMGGEMVILHDMIPFGDVPKILSVSDLVVLPQRKLKQTSGQIPAKIFDAMAMAKPIIATDVSDMREILDGCGLIVEPENIEHIAEKIEWALSHPDETEEMGSKAREKCIKEYSWDIMEQRLSKIFDKYM